MADTTNSRAGSGRPPGIRVGEDGLTGRQRSAAPSASHGSH